MCWDHVKQYTDTLKTKFAAVQRDLSIIFGCTRDLSSLKSFARDFVLEPTRPNANFFLELIWNIFFIDRKCKEPLGQVLKKVTTLGLMIEYLKVFMEDKLYEFPDSIIDLVRDIDAAKFYCLRV